MATVASPRETAVEDFVSQLEQRMDDLGLTPVELAKKAKVGFPYLYRVLNREQKPSMEWADRVGRKVGLRVRTIVEPTSKSA